MTPIERAARALCELDGHPPDATMDGKPLWQDYLPEVQAVFDVLHDHIENGYLAGVEYAADYEGSSSAQPAIDALRHVLDVLKPE